MINNITKLSSSIRNMFILLSVITLCVPSCLSHNTTDLHKGLTERIGNFSVELLYHAMRTHEDANMIISPIMIWSALAVMAEGASSNTLTEISRVTRILPQRRGDVRKQFQTLNEYLKSNTSSIELERINVIFVPQFAMLQKDIVEEAENYDVQIVSVSDPKFTVYTMNSIASTLTKAKISEFVSIRDMTNSSVFLSSALYFKGQWAVPFQPANTKKSKFYNSDCQITGYVNMMHKKYPYLYADIKELQARVVEIPYDSQNSVSMLIMLPITGVSIEKMLRNFATVPLDTIFEMLNASKHKYTVDLYVPRFKIDSDLDLSQNLRDIGLHDLFDADYVRLPRLASRPMHVSKVSHKANIEITEEGTESGADISTEIDQTNLTSITFNANRPFWYLIIEKVTNSIGFGGYYKNPSLY